jgi:hypothetical protein
MARMGPETYFTSGPQKTGMFQFLPVPTMMFRSWRSCSP